MATSRRTVGMLVRRARRWLPLAALTAAITILLGTTSTSTAAATTSSPITWCTDKSSMDIVGDSGSTGYGVIDPNNHWVAKLRQAKPNTRINNYAHDGAMVSDFLPGGRWPETTGAVAQIGVDQPSLVLIELGGNEYYIDRDPALYKANLETLTQKIWQVSPRSTIIYETIWPFDPRQSTTVHSWNEYGTAMLQVAVEYSAGWIDLRQFFPPHYANDTYTHLLNTDQIHPTDAGNAVEYTAVLNIINRC